MEVKIDLNLDELKGKLCPECREVMDRYLKELAVAQLIADTKKDNGE